MSKGQHKGGVVCTVQSVDIQLFSYLHIWSHVQWVQKLKNSEIVSTMLAKIQKETMMCEFGTAAFQFCF